MKGTFISIWDDGIEISSPAELNEQTGELIVEQVSIDNLDILDNEIFIDESGNEFEVCEICHNYIMKTIMVDGIGHTYEEKSVCSNKYCENGELN